MKALLRWLSNLFFHDRYQTAADEIFVPVDPDAVCRNLDVEREARQNGSRNLPEMDALPLDATEERIVHVFQQELQSTARRVSDKLQIYRRQLERQNMRREHEAIDGIGRAFAAESVAVIEESRDQLEPAIALRSDLRNELDRFRERHGVDRAPDFPESKFFYLAVLVAIFVAESVLNAFFFAAGSDFGLLGGWIDAMRYAGVNIAVAFLIGNTVVREIHHQNALRKLVGIAGLLALIILIPLFNLFVAHYRELFAVDPDAAQTAAIDAFLNNALGLVTVESWLLLAVGCLFAAIAAYEGYAIDDPYPGYGRLARRAQRAHEDYLDEKQETKERLATLRDGALASLERWRAAIGRKQEELLDLSGLADTVRSKFDMHRALLQKSCNVVVSRYRDTNRRARNAAAPPYFDDDIDISDTLRLDLPATLSFDEVQATTEDIAAIVGSANSKRASIEAAYADYLQRLDASIERLETD